MSRWFRHYAGLCRDDKLVRVALKSKQSVERVVWVWSAILESASEIDDHGRFDFDVGEAAYFLRADEADVEAICLSLECLGRISSGTVAKWDDRQFVSDRSAERQKRYRDKQRSHDDHNANVGVTSPSRHADAPETETELETDKIIDADASIADAAAPPVCLRSDEDRKRIAEKRKAVLRSLGERWNTFAGELRLPLIEEIKTGSPRERSALARVRDGCDFDRVFAKIRASPFLRGEKGSTPASFDWITNPTNYQKIIEGNYDEVRQAQRR